MNDSNRPTAQGSLAKTPFAHLVLYLYQKRSSGTLIVRTRDLGESKVLFHRGRAVAAHTPQPSAALDQGLLPLCAEADGKFEFFETDLVGSGPSIVTGMFDPLAFVAESARRFVRADVVQDVATKFAGTELAIQPAMDLTRLSLTPAETQFAEPLLRGPVTFEGLQAQSRLDPETELRLLYVLLITKVVGPYDAQAAANFQQSGPSGTGSTPADASVSSDATARSGRTPSDRSRNSGAAWRAIASRAAEMATNRPSPASGTAAPASTPARRTSSSDAIPRRPSSSQPSAAGAPPTELPRRGVTQPLHTKPRALTSPVPESAAARPTKPGPNPISRPITRPFTPPPGQRPVSRPITPARFAEPPEGRPASRPISRPLTPATFGTPSPLPRTTPSAPVSRVTPRPSQPDLESLDANGKFKRIEQL
ncbi:MAG TPA: hypothetical protein VHZ95_22555, partial [Polyangiales bacterium]|nr:hypothetical protein [Polyangiales bacterium]